MHQPFSRALFLALSCLCYRLLSGAFPELLPNISPLIAAAFVGAIYLPRAWGWLIGPAVFLATDAAFLTTNQHAAGAMFSWWTLVSLAFYLAAGGLGLLVARHRSLGKIVAGSIACSVVFYVVANTFAWWNGAALTGTGLPVYAPTWAGWWQANTVGLPGWAPTWTFLRNGVLGDLFFAGVLVAVFDPQLLIRPFGIRKAVVSA